jgi:hypothetical protein
VGEKTASVGPFQIPTAPAALTAVAQSASANTLGSAVSFGNAPSYTAPDNASVTAIKAKTDSLNFTVAGKLDVNLLVVNGVTVGGAGTAGNPWGPA